MSQLDASHILYEAGPCLVVCKPAGVLTQAPPGIDSMEVRVKDFLQAREQKTGNMYLGVPHRLDRPVSGALVFARHTRACRRLAEQFAGRTVQKVYWACVGGRVEPPQGSWHDWVRKVPGEARAELVGEADPEGRVAKLHYRTRGETPYGSWLEIELETGRTHQIRIQTASRGHPVLGDTQYGSRIPFGPQPDDLRLRAIALHARQLTFQHPMTWEEVRVVAPLPTTWDSLVDAGRLSPGQQARR